MSDWDDYVKSLKRSHKAVEFVAKFFRDQGWMVDVPELVIAPERADAKKYVDYGDSFVKGVYEVKERRKIKITSESYGGFDDVIVCGCKRYDEANPKPVFIAHLSCDWKHIAIVKPMLTFHHWTTKDVWNKTFKKNIPHYICDFKYFKVIRTHTK